MEWGGWSYDEPLTTLRAPHEVRFRRPMGIMMRELISARGRPVPAEAICDAIRRVTLMPQSLSPVGMAGSYASQIRERVGRCAVYRIEDSFALRPAAEAARMDEELRAELGRRRADEAVARAAREAKREERRRLELARQAAAEARKAEGRERMSEKRRQLEQLFADQFEATGPHARAVARTVFEIMKG